MFSQCVVQYSTAGTNLLPLIWCAACLKRVPPPPIPRVILFSYRNAAAKLSTALFSYVTAETRNAGYAERGS
jgi:hypothetical protein